MLFIVDRDNNFKVKVGEDVTRCELLEKRSVNEYFPWFECEQTWNIEVRNLDARVIEVLLGTGVFYNLNREMFYGIFPGGMTTRKFHFLAVIYDERGDEKIYLGTDFICTSGIPWTDIASGECSLIDLEFRKEWREVDWSRAEKR